MDWLGIIILVMILWFFAGVLIRISEDKNDRRGLTSL
jgi:hypothetical protein